MSKSTKERYRYTQNRELSWLRFNQRVLEEAADRSVPILERLKFVSIFSSNLDEFFMVRVGSLFDLARMAPDVIDSKTGQTSKEQLDHIYRAVPGLIAMKAKIYSEVMKELEIKGLRDVRMNELDAEGHKQVNRFFMTELLPVISPILIGPNHPVPHLINKKLYAAAFLENKKGHKAVGIVPVPASISPYLMLSDGKSFVRTENILLQWLPTFFENYTVKEDCVLTVTRNADISFDEEKFDDSEESFRLKMKKLIKKRDFLSPVRLELSEKISEEFQKTLASLVQVEAHRIFTDPTPLNMSYVFRLTGELPRDFAERNLFSEHGPRWPEDMKPDVSVIKQVQENDRILYYPYDSVEPFLKLLNEAANDLQVLSIKITIYRLASSSKIANILCRAAENGKEVLVLMELRARFDEENNLTWSQMLEDAGCQVIYGTEGFKCHSKICLITMRNHGKFNYITQVGTGNYNEKTNRMYTDISIMTANDRIGEDAASFFRNMLVNKLDGRYSELCVSPFGIKSMLINNIDRQIALGKEGYICIKANSVTECDIIDKIAEASRAGVEIQLIIRGICCILPEITYETENVHVTSIVGRFLEHARVYVFGRGNDADVYISSADLMTRNLNRRVEIAFPVHNSGMRDQLLWILKKQLSDTVKASKMLPDGTYCRKDSAMGVDSQSDFIRQSIHTPPTLNKDTHNFKDWLKSVLVSLRKRKQ